MCFSRGLDLNLQKSYAGNSLIKFWFCASIAVTLNPGKKKGPRFFSSTTVQFNQLKDSSCPENNKQAVCGRPTLSASNELFKILPPSYLKSHIARFFHSTAFKSLPHTLIPSPTPTPLCLWYSLKHHDQLVRVSLLIRAVAPDDC